MMSVQFFFGIVFGRLHTAHSATKPVTLVTSVTEKLTNDFLFTAHSSPKHFEATNLIAVSNDIANSRQVHLSYITNGPSVKFFGPRLVFEVLMIQHIDSSMRKTTNIESKLISYLLALFIGAIEGNVIHF